MDANINNDATEATTVEVDAVEVFAAEEVEVEEVDVEAYAKRDERVPKARRYKVRIDKHPYVVTTATPTGAELLKLAGKTPETHKLYQVLRGRQPEPVGPKQTVDLRAPGVERFTTIPKDPTEGEPIRQFSLPELDADTLNSMGLQWETIREGAAMWLVVHGWLVPGGYNLDTTSLALQIPQGYPDTQIDMVYFFPHLTRTDGKPIRQLTETQFQAKRWQRWSRHRTDVNPWRPGFDSVESHLALVDDWLRREFERG